MSPLVTQLSWTNHLLIMSGSKSDEEREFYMCLAVQERYSKRQLERQMDSGYYERYALQNQTAASGVLSNFIHTLKYENDHVGVLHSYMAVFLLSRLKRVSLNLLMLQIPKFIPLISNFF